MQLLLDLLLSGHHGSPVLLLAHSLNLKCSQSRLLLRRINGSLHALLLFNSHRLGFDLLGALFRYVCHLQLCLQLAQRRVSVADALDLQTL